MDFGSFDGVPTVTFLDDGRRVQLAAPFGYVDAASARWNVPVKAIVDGASIPRALWTLIGGPFEGKYRAPSIIHDWYCDLRTRRWEDVHHVFYEGMLAAGVSRPQALLIYGGVYWGGPRWSQTVVDNTNLLADYLADSRPGSTRLHYPMLADEFGGYVRQGPYEDRVLETRYRYAFTEQDLDALACQLATGGARTPEDVSAVVDEHLRDRRADNL